MRRLIPLLSLVALMSVCVEDAFAGEGVWGWLEQFSGPGPFKRNGNEISIFGAATYCGSPDGKGVHIKGLGSEDWRTGTPEGNAVCLWADVRREFVAPPNDFYKKVTASIYDAGPTVSFQRAASVGVGVGILRFSSDTDAEDKKKTKFFVEPIRVTIIPGGVLLAAFDERINNRFVNNLVHVPQFYGKVICVAGKLQTADFAGVSTHSYQTRNECINSWGLQFNLLEFTK
jgi:hypothetical protein